MKHLTFATCIPRRPFQRKRLVCTLHFTQGAAHTQLDICLACAIQSLFQAVGAQPLAYLISVDCLIPPLARPSFLKMVCLPLSLPQELIPSMFTAYCSASS